MNFKKYGSLINHYMSKSINRIRDRGLDSGIWVALEKIHGANLGLWCDGTSCWKSNRTGICDDKFFNSHKLNKYNDCVLSTYDNLLSSGFVKEGSTIVLYGEIFGGNFFGSQEDGVGKIQRKVDYHPGIEFACYDISVFNLDGEEYCLSYMEMLDNIDENIPLCPEISRGTFDEVFDTSNDFPSRVPGMFGLIVPDGKHSQCEGFVMKPLLKNIYTHNGTRCIIKSKNTKFNEKGGKSLTSPVDLILTDEEEYIYKKISPYINTTRLESVISKIGIISWKDFAKVNGLFIQDALCDFESENETRIKGSDVWSKIKKPLNGISMEIVREYLRVTLEEEL